MKLKQNFKVDYTVIHNHKENNNCNITQVLDDSNEYVKHDYMLHYI